MTDLGHNVRAVKDGDKVVLMTQRGGIDHWIALDAKALQRLRKMVGK